MSDYYFDIEINGATVETVEGHYSPEIVDVTQVIPAVEVTKEEALEDDYEVVTLTESQEYLADEIYYVTKTVQIPLNTVITPNSSAAISAVTTETKSISKSAAPIIKSPTL